ncbi:ribulose 1,5-bisphosphate carboxylase large subunit [Heliobacillus mobilis]|uniref:Ribulose 1,5-bisphosphate carboxylase large subunit n=1 Tax=Heliobacterium mobile TaxID=28064 RepID=Q0PID8_HELMO|nr:RuBisCO large subunit C-terminal-like domain-containing protein [Heliobacterium mobile]ABH04879.1 RubisCO-like protein [Heliobacterium mobile]MTV48402.1 ribulose 1,5-bisphosphate carboxylase large subunit [Heliobacterium mobile]
MISGERFSVIYRLVGSEKEAIKKALDICLEQTVEFPEELVPRGMIRDHVVGRIESVTPISQASCRVTISYAVETASGELTQLLNVIFGNISIKPGIVVEEIYLPESLLKSFRGPRFGRQGLRKLLGVPHRPLLFTALKPMGLSTAELAKMAYECALGGIDIIKDDHGLTNQVFAPYEERVRLCTQAVAKANQETGFKAIYVPNVTAPYNQLFQRARFAKEVGAQGLMISPALAGLDTMRELADDDSLALPIFSHPAFQGSYVTSAENGISHFALFGQITRLAGADGVVYPNFGGRFSFSREECRRIAEGTETPMGHIQPIFPCPGGGMSLEAIPDMLQVYGRDVTFLIGGGLFRHGPDLVENCRYFREMVEKMV